MANSRKSSSDKLGASVAAVVSRLIPSGSRILVGLSGGIDSVVLLHLLAGLAPHHAWRISALHVHHGISPNADHWAKFCIELCAELGIALHVEHVDIEPLRARGIEAAARELRHAAFACQPCDFVALAHHADDQVETLLLQLLRGCGVRGASAMAQLGPGKLVRPLLYCTRDEISAYAEAFGLRWIEDESNADQDYPRNFLRHRLLPELESKFPSYRATLTRSTRHFAEAAGLLDELAHIDAASSIRQDRLALSSLQGLSEPRAKNLLRHFLHLQGAPMPQESRLSEMLQQLSTAQQGASVCIDFGGWQVRRYRDFAYALRDPGEFDRHLVLRWQGEASLPWPALGGCVEFSEGQGISLERLSRAEVTLRLRQGGEVLRLQQSGRTLKNLLQQHEVPPWLRERWPLLYCGDELVLIPGIAIADEYRAKNGEASLSVRCGTTATLPEGGA